METLLNAVSLDTLLVIAAYAALGAAYLVVVPLVKMSALAEVLMH